DGDGMIHAFDIDAGQVRYRNRFVDTVKKRAEDAAGKRLFGGFGTPPAGAPWQRLSRGYGNTANTNVVWHAGKLLALQEAGRPHRLDPVTLATIGEEDFEGALPAGAAFSAHPKYDPRTGEMVNFGVAYGSAPAANLYVVDKDGALRSLPPLKLPFGAMIHDFALTATKIVFICGPLTLPRVPFGLITHQSSFADSLRWEPERRTRVAILDRASGEARWLTTGAFMLFHVVNAFDDGDDVVVDLCAYEDGSIVRRLGEIMRGLWQRTDAIPTRLRVGSQVSTSRLGDLPLELPRVGRNVLTREHQLFFGIVPSDDTTDDVLFGLAKYDLHHGTAVRYPLPAGHFAGEPVFVPAAGGNTEDGGYLVSLILDAAARRSYLAVLDAADPTAPLIARADLPHIAPFGFHGSFVAA
ncbi:MAG TPA: carotenoid oxygenase family protein, partial [Chloroflexota bacterium]